ncbi:peptidase S41-like protein [Chitinophaga dinghuensis]|uniref:Peptidase S41-like protein n=1 Tax=Chitinophaga dinghuensis TaxID=1539050 RepID=A0A327VTT4_9BACT|nr:S41 family peptidase [Chitinophaga dinghuensis]RAJ77368.1 peptidase S41-like protein [Chitinophaga dinghuensis]
MHDNKPLIRIFFLNILLTLVMTSSAQLKSVPDTSHQQLSVKAMREDLSTLWAAISDMHPAYGLYTATDSLRTVYDNTVRRIQQPMSESEFITIVYPLISALKCGHTQIKHSAHFRPAAADQLPSLPFKVLVRQHRAWITSHQLKEVRTGDEILSINGVAVKDIIQHGSDLYAADGNNQTFKELFLSEYDGFEDACNKYYKWKPPYAIKLKTVQGKVITISADTLPATAPQAEIVQVVDNRRNWKSAVGEEELPLRWLNNAAVACLEVHSYQYEDTLVFSKAFKAIRENGVQTLIIDLRHNTGGDIRIAAKLLTYLADSAFQMVGNLWARVPNPGKTKFDPYLDTAKTLSFMESFRPTGIRNEGRYYMAFQSGFVNLLEKMELDKKDHFDGTLIVLIDGATFSSGAHTAAAIRKYCSKSTFIGRETAGGAEGCSGGTIQDLTLPNTGIVITFPLLRVVSVLNPMIQGHGIMPDREVVYTPTDIVTNRDRDLEEAVKMIASGKNR